MQGHLQPLWHSCRGRYNVAPNQLTLIESSLTAECSGTTCGRGSGRKGCGLTMVNVYRTHPRFTEGVSGRRALLAWNVIQPQLGRRSPHVGRFPPGQRADTSTATKTAATLPGAAGSRGATVNQPPKSVVLEICTPRSVGTGGGRPPPVTRWALSNERPYRDHRLKRDQPNLFMNARPRSPLHKIFRALKAD